MTGRLLVDGAAAHRPAAVRRHAATTRRGTGSCSTFDDGARAPPPRPPPPRRSGTRPRHRPARSRRRDRSPAEQLTAGARPAPRTALKARLLDQRRVAGLGNLLVDESLWRAGLDPARPAGEPPGRRGRPGSPPRSSTTVADLTERGGSHTGDLQPARERGATCPRDGAPLQRRTIGGRTTYSCPGPPTLTHRGAGCSRPRATGSLAPPCHAPARARQSTPPDSGSASRPSSWSASACSACVGTGAAADVVAAARARTTTTTTDAWSRRRSTRPPPSTTESSTPTTEPVDVHRRPPPSDAPPPRPARDRRPRPSRPRSSDARPRPPSAVETTTTTGRNLLVAGRRDRRGRVDHHDVDHRRRRSAMQRGLSEGTLDLAHRRRPGRHRPADRTVDGAVLADATAARSAADVRTPSDVRLGRLAPWPTNSTSMP